MAYPMVKLTSFFVSVAAALGALDAADLSAGIGIPVIIVVAAASRQDSRCSEQRHRQLCHCFCNHL